MVRASQRLIAQKLLMYQVHQVYRVIPYQNTGSEHSAPASHSVVSRRPHLTRTRTLQTEPGNTISRRNSRPIPLTPRHISFNRYLVYSKPFPTAAGQFCPIPPQREPRNPFFCFPCTSRTFPESYLELSSTHLFSEHFSEHGKK